MLINDVAGIILLYDLGLVDYRKVWVFQKELSDLRNVDLADDSVLVLEHPDTYTAGIHTPDGPLPPEVIRVERGGGVTYHGPGQLVIYFIVNLKHSHMNVRDLIEWVHGVIVSLLSRHGISAESRLGKETGVWIGRRKIASTGFAVNGFTTYHGTALNITTDLTKFQRISPCGFDPEIMTSMETELGQNLDFEKIKHEIIDMLRPEVSETL